MRQSLIIISLFILSSCGQRYRNVSEFNLKPSALKDGEKIRLVFSLAGDGNNKEGEYYNHLIVVSEESGDTCNVLIPVNHGFGESDGDKVFNYFSPDNESTKFALLEPEAMKDVKNVSELKNVIFPSYHKVIYSREAEDWLMNKYPTVKGFVGTTN